MNCMDGGEGINSDVICISHLPAERRPVIIVIFNNSKSTIFARMLLWRSVTLQFIVIYSVLAIPKRNVQDDLFSCDFNGAFNSYNTESFSIYNAEKTQEIFWSPHCDSHVYQGICPPNSLICLRHVGKEQQDVLNLGNAFILIFKGDWEIRLKSLGGTECVTDRTRNYTVYVSFNGHVTQPYLESTDDECNYNIQIPIGTIEHPCTKRVGAFLLDLRDLSKDFVVKDVNRTFTFNLCKSASNCNYNDISSCVVGPRNDALGVVSSRRITYEEQDASIQFHFHNGAKAARRLSTKVDLNCNWDVLYDNARYIPSPSNKTFKFTVDSILGCVKLPMNCKVVDLNKYEYDLSVLNKLNDSWSVSNEWNKTIRMNICGPLRNTEGDCNHREAQVCEDISQERHLSYGSILTNKRVEGGVIKATFSHGSVCPKNHSHTLTTDLNFMCSLMEKGPRLLKIGDCHLEMIWETPAACPQQTVTAVMLNMHDSLGNRNLMQLCGEDRRHRVTPSSYLRYNLCSPLKESCDGRMNVSICLHLNDKQESVLGIYKKEKLLSRNGVLSMKFLGGSCRQVHVSFACDYEAAARGQVSVQIVRDYCSYNMHVKAPGACLRAFQDEKNCTVMLNGNRFYNLTGLALSDRNYRHLNKETGVEYILNICRPVIAERDVLCQQNTGVCIHNRTEPNFMKRFLTIGSYPGSLEIENDQLVMKFHNGYMCTNGRFASAIVRFLCSDVEEPVPTLLTTTSCLYEFAWKTKHGCPKKLVDSSDTATDNTVNPLSCIIRLEDDSLLDLTDVKHTEFELPYGDSEEVSFSICSDMYTRRNQNGDVERKSAIRNVDRKTILFTVNNKCDNTLRRKWNKVKVRFRCRKANEETFELVSVENCTVHVLCNSNVFCNGNYETFDEETSLRQTTTTRSVKSTKIPAFTPVPIAATSGRLEKTHVCTFAVSSTEINLNTLMPFSVRSNSGNRYSVGVRAADEGPCNGYVCKGDLSLASLRTCPNVSIADSQARVVFNDTRLPDNVPFTTVVVFKCGTTAEEPQVKTENDTCLILSYPLDRLCASSSPAAWISGTVAVLLVVVAIAIGVWWVKRRRRPYACIARDNSDMYLYARDTQA